MIHDLLDAGFFSVGCDDAEGLQDEIGPSLGVAGRGEHGCMSLEGAGVGVDDSGGDDLVILIEAIEPCPEPSCEEFGGEIGAGAEVDLVLTFGKDSEDAAHGEVPVEHDTGVFAGECLSEGGDTLAEGRPELGADLGCEGGELGLIDGAFIAPFHVGELDEAPHAIEEGGVHDAGGHAPGGVTGAGGVGGEDEAGTGDHVSDLAGGSNEPLAGGVQQETELFELIGGTAINVREDDDGGMVLPVFSEDALGEHLPEGAIGPRRTFWLDLAGVEPALDVGTCREGEHGCGGAGQIGDGVGEGILPGARGAPDVCGVSAVDGDHGSAKGLLSGSRTGEGVMLWEGETEVFPDVRVDGEGDSHQLGLKLMGFRGAGALDLLAVKRLLQVLGDEGICIGVGIDTMLLNEMIVKHMGLMPTDGTGNHRRGALVEGGTLYHWIR